MKGQEELKALKINEQMLLPEGNIINLVFGVGLCIIGYIVYESYENNISIALMIFGALMFIAGSLSYLWKSPFVYLIEAPIFATVIVTFVLNPRTPLTEGRMLFALLILGFAAWVVVNDVGKFVLLSSVRSKLKKLSEQ